jgi:DNA-binding transcriptional regulator YdaS (Cro superfamily)
MDALDEAVKKAGSQAALAAMCGVVQGAVSNWKSRGTVPAEYCPAIEKGTGVACERLRPDVDWAFIRAGGAVAAQQQAA